MYDDKAYSPDTAAETKRDGEVSRQLKLLSLEIKDCLSRSGTLVERLAAIVSPRAEPSQLEAGAHDALRREPGRPHRATTASPIATSHFFLVGSNSSGTKSPAEAGCLSLNFLAP